MVRRGWSSTSSPLGNVLSVEDARGDTAETRVFGMLQQVLRTDSEDAGWRLGLTDVASAVVRSWNERGFASRIDCDALVNGRWKARESGLCRGGCAGVEISTGLSGLA
jgi:hypothetical protein